MINPNYVIADEGRVMKSDDEGSYKEGESKGGTEEE